VELPKRYDPMDPRAAVLDRWWYTVAALAFVPETLAYHRARGVAEHTSRATLADLGRHARIHARTYGRSGLATESWIQLHLRGLLYDLGRLQFNLTTLRLPAAMMAAAGMAAEPGDVVLDTHIPETGPLTPDEVTASLGRARGFFAAHFPEHAPYRWALCHSWLLDPQLSTLLPGSNIDAFSRRWTVLDPGDRADQSARDFIFRMPGVPSARCLATPASSARSSTIPIERWPPPNAGLPAHLGVPRTPQVDVGRRRRAVPTGPARRDRPVTVRSDGKSSPIHFWLRRRQAGRETTLGGLARSRVPQSDRRKRPP
jgi:hypothetical protein